MRYRKLFLSPDHVGHVEPRELSGLTDDEWAALVEATRICPDDVRGGVRFLEAREVAGWARTLRLGPNGTSKIVSVSAFV